MFLKPAELGKIAPIAAESPQRSEDLERKAGCPFINYFTISLLKI